MKLKKYIFLVFVLFQVIYSSFAQDTDSMMTVQTRSKFFSYQNDIGINVTNLLSKIISLGNDDQPAFNISYRRKNEASGLRLSLHIFFDKKTDAPVNGFDVDRTEHDYKLRFGYEFYKSLSKRFTFAYGPDVLYLNTQSKSVSPQSGFTNDIKEYKFGIGPALRFEYKLSDRISLMTESTAYFLTGKKKNLLLQNGAPPFETNSKSWEFATHIPSVLFLNIHF